MEATTSTIIMTLCRMQGFLNAETIVAAGLEAARHRLDTATAELVALATAQDGCRRAGVAATKQLQVLQRELRMDHMRPIAEITKRTRRPMADRDALELPPSNVATDALVAAAHAMSSAAAPEVKTFIGAGLPADFAFRLRSAADALGSLLEQRRQHLETRGASTLRLMAATAEGRVVIKLVDALVQPRVRGDAMLLDAWNAAARGEKAVHEPGGQPHRALKLV